MNADIKELLTELNTGEYSYSPIVGVIEQVLAVRNDGFPRHYFVSRIMNGLDVCEAKICSFPWEAELNLIYMLEDLAGIKHESNTTKFECFE